MAQISSDFIDNIKTQFPEHLSFDKFIEYCHKPLRRSIRVNTLRITVDSFLKMMESKGWTFESIPWCESGFWITTPNIDGIGNVLEHLQGLFYIQEASSMLPPIALFDELNSADNVLDMAAAPGSKTTQIAAMMNNSGSLIANEYSSSRVKMLHANIVRMGVKNCTLTHFDATVFGQYLFEEFDAILLDAPCGGEGTVRKDPSALKDWSLDKVLSISEKQKELIQSAFAALKVGGTLIYSTCTLSQQENQQVCLYLKELYPEAVEFVSLHQLFDGSRKSCTPEGFLHVWPQLFDSEGFFVAKIKKLQSIEKIKPEPKLNTKFPYTPIRIKEKKDLMLWLENSYGITLPADAPIMCRENQYWLFPIHFKHLMLRMRYQRIGLKLAEQKGKRLKVSHEAIVSLCSTSEHRIELTELQAVEYLKGRDIQLDIAEKSLGEKIVCHKSSPLGLVKHLGNRLKNNLPRDLVRDNTAIG
ncbi:16S rRNA (cytosine(1407)-C(5))-methyltransferase RsmF [Parashewanella spongiae]|uniref:Ribosomal RNA small subunit methyltransferase F n=1 Tax=Parashewanella spongiae TaxID=342950 RepID=A0A3A6UL30_9GAMM|nr:16S rRNA (cytosine(1407)-C(5))-methyltransferase RsmF [Parashewanella spongiae]MCL1077344.1 16S rRNA (cytosine(1407)-C(5))-methyltransferase RsmF [Parashewanella spongiae]RJY18311.1 16S rRNA (cytosine(1407)-C(5))-methyltransferase RsmF [Parashewanella spongiae]